MWNYTKKIYNAKFVYFIHVYIFVHLYVIFTSLDYLRCTYVESESGRCFYGSLFH